jgi:ankyrin repeat protein
MTDHNIHYLIEANQIEVIKRLMLYKSDKLDINLTNNNNQTPIQIAEKLNRYEIIKLLKNFENDYTK